MPPEREDTSALLLRLARLHFLLPGVLLYILGYGLAMSRGASLDITQFAFGYAIFFFAHLSVSFSNDYFDSESDAHAQRTPLSGGSGVLVEHPELRRSALGIGVALLVASAVAAVVFTLHYSYGMFFAAFAIAGGLLGWFYSAPPARLSYRGLGEVSTALAAGLVMPGMGYLVAAGTLDPWFLLLSVPLICYGFFFIFTVEMPDVDSDRRADKVNTLVRKGRRAGLHLSVVVTVLGTAMLITLAALRVLENSEMIATLSALSLVPLLGALLGLRIDPEDREQLIRQVKLNFGTMMSFLVLANVSVYLTIFG